MTQPSCPSALYSTIAPIVPWFLVVVGWAVINHQQNNRETRKEIRAMVDRARKDIDSIESLAIEYHTSPDHDEKNAREVKRRLDKLSQTIRHIGIGQGNARAQRVVQLRKAITLHNFDTATHAAQDIGSEQIARMLVAADTLSDYIESSFRQRFGPKP